MNDWLDDLEPSGGSDGSLFEENFRKLLDDGDVENMALQTVEEQVERIDDPDLLGTAIEQDDRDDAEPIYRDRIGTINGQVMEAESEPEEVDESETVEDVIDDVIEEGAEDAEGGEDDDEPEDPQEKARTAMGCTECDDIVKDKGEIVKPFDTVDGSVVCEECQEAAEDDEDDAESEDDQSDPDEDETDPDPPDDAEDTDDDESATDLPDVDVASLAPDAIDREAAAAAEKERTLLVWGPEGSGKTHIAHSAPEPICYIDTEGKADELAEKFDKTIHYFEADDYKEAKAAMEQSFDVLAEYLDAGVRGTLVVDSMTAMWEYAKVDWAKYAYQTDDLSEVNFQSELEGEQDWTKIKARHNDSFREEILESPYHVVFTSGQKEAYYSDEEWVPDGEKWNKYAVKDVVQLRRGADGKTVADLRKAAKTRRSFIGLEWPTWESVYDAVTTIHEAEQATEPVETGGWPFGVIDGQPVGDSPDGSDGGDDDE